MDKEFVWDRAKQKANAKKHGVSFNEASSVFDDEDAVYFDDWKHSQSEDRFIVIGFSRMDRLLMVCHCYRENEVIRIISARKADKMETEYYYEGGA